MDIYHNTLEKDRPVFSKNWALEIENLSGVDQYKLSLCVLKKYHAKKMKKPALLTTQFQQTSCNMPNTCLT